MATLQERIKERRNEQGFTLLDLANILGVKEATVQRYESGEIKNIKHETVVKLADILNCSPQYLMGWVDIPNELSPIDVLTPKKQALLKNFECLNSSGQDKAIDYVSDLADNPKYQKEDAVQETSAPYIPEVLAAHHPTGKLDDEDREIIDGAIQFVGKLKRKKEERG